MRASPLGHKTAGDSSKSNLISTERVKTKQKGKGDEEEEDEDQTKKENQKKIPHNNEGTGQIRFRRERGQEPRKKGDLKKEKEKKGRCVQE